MGSTEKTYEKIEQYLNGSLPDEDLIEFQTKLKSDIGFAQEVNLHKELSDFLAPSDEDDFRENLKILNGRLKDKSRFGNLNKGWLFIIPILLLSSWWFFNQNSDAVVTDKEVPELENPKPEELQNEKEILIDKKDSNPIPEKETDKKTEAKEKKIQPTEDKRPPKFAEKQKQGKKNQLLAVADFKPNPSLELLIENNLRSNDIKFEVTSQPLSEVRTTKDKPVLFEFSGNFTSSENLKEKDVNLHIFSNSLNDYQNFLPLFSEKINLFGASNEALRFKISKTILLKPGLYYYLLEDEETEELFYVQKFKIVPPE